MEQLTFENKKAIVRMLTHTQDEQSSMLLEMQLNDILAVTEIYHILAASKLVGEVIDKPFELPRDLVEIKELIEGLGKEKESDESTISIEEMKEKVEALI